MKYIIAVFLIITLASCVEYGQVQNISNRNRGFIVYDTILIKDVPHEFIFSMVYGGYSIVHSPECPCIKNKED